MRKLHLAVAVALVLANAAFGATEVNLQTRSNYVFQADGVRISNKFSGARFNHCERLEPGKYRLLIKAENTPINRSPWYAFKIRAQETRTVEVTLRYENARHRYHPQVSHDQRNWLRLDDSQIQLSPQRTEATLKLKIGPEPQWIAGQEMTGLRELQSWIKTLAAKDGVERAPIGHSVAGRRIDGLQFGSTTATNFIVIVSRQHPPEITGTLGLMAFIRKLLDDSEASVDFRKNLAVLLVPLMNPDGVHEGHWRHNLNGVDLNRDWKEFKQPETRAVRDWIVSTLAKRQGRPLLFLDFHSTRYDVFYTQKDEHPTTPPDFTKKWLKAIDERLPDYTPRRSPSHNMAKATSKAWAYDRFACPAITYEYGDHTDRDLIRRQTTVAAEEMVKLMLEFVGP